MRMFVCEYVYMNLYLNIFIYIYIRIYIYVYVYIVGRHKTHLWVVMAYFCCCTPSKISLITHINGLASCQLRVPSQHCTARSAVAMQTVTV